MGARADSGQMDIFTYQQGQWRGLHHTKEVKRGGQELTIEERFQRFHEASPIVAQALAGMALELKQAGVQHFGIKALFETLRYKSAIETRGEPWKLNNNFTAHNARHSMATWPQLDGFFELRRSEADV